MFDLTVFKQECFDFPYKLISIRGCFLLVFLKVGIILQTGIILVVFSYAQKQKNAI